MRITNKTSLSLYSVPGKKTSKGVEHCAGTQFPQQSPCAGQLRGGGKQSRAQRPGGPRVPLVPVCPCPCPCPWPASPPLRHFRPPRAPAAHCACPGGARMRVCGDGDREWGQGVGTGSGNRDRDRAGRESRDREWEQGQGVGTGQKSSLKSAFSLIFNAGFEW